MRPIALARRKAPGRTGSWLVANGMQLLDFFLGKKNSEQRMEIWAGMAMLILLK